MSKNDLHIYEKENEIEDEDNIFSDFGIEIIEKIILKNVSNIGASRKGISINM